MIYRSLIAIVALSVSASAMAGFSIDSAGAISTQHGAMGSYEPAERAAAARFRGPAVNNGSVQKRYRDAELLVDLAYKPVTQRGSGRPERVEGFGDSMPLAVAMSMILPTGWQLYRDSSLKAGETPVQISFSGGADWPDLLAAVGERYALKFHIDWYDHTVMMGKGRPGATYHASAVPVIAEPPKAVAPVRVTGAMLSRPGPDSHVAAAAPQAAKPAKAIGQPEAAKPLAVSAAVVPVKKADWLSEKKVSVTGEGAPLTVAQALAQLEQQGIKAILTAEQGSTRYPGPSLASLDGREALKAILTPAGLDFAETPARTIVVRPIQPQTFPVRRAEGQTNPAAVRAFWADIERQVSKLMSPCLRTSAARPCAAQKAGNYAINPDTRTVTVNAPHWVAEDIKRYLVTVKEPSKDDMRSLVKGTVFKQ